jgi:hypothetical protein
MDGDGDSLAIAGECLVDGVVDDLEHHMVQAGVKVGACEEEA